MSIPVRNADQLYIVANERTFFITPSTFGKRSLLQTDRAARLFIDTLYHYRTEANYRLHEFVVMLDHFHLLITVGATISVEKAVQLIKGGFAFRAGRELGFHAPVWQKGFSEVRVNDSDAFAKIKEYIVANPVQRSLAAASADFLYSSAHSTFALDPPPQRLKARQGMESVGIAKAMP